MRSRRRAAAVRWLRRSLRIFPARWVHPVPQPTAMPLRPTSALRLVALPTAILPRTSPLRQLFSKGDSLSCLENRFLVTEWNDAQESVQRTSPFFKMRGGRSESFISGATNTTSEGFRFRSAEPSQQGCPSLPSVSLKPLLFRQRAYSPSCSTP